jgi:hypothetical protein
MSKDYTLEKLSQYESLIEKVKSKNLYDKWFGYKSSNLHDNNVLIEFSDFEFIEKENYFSISFLQKIYADLNSNFDLIIENFFTWCHCGGAGGIVLNSFRKGYDGGEQWGEGLTISYKGKEFDYKSNYHQRRLNFHLDKFIDNIECENKNIEQFLHDN